MVEYLETVAIAAGLAMTLQFVADLLQYQTLKSRNLELRSAIQDSYRKANPRGAVVDVEKQLNRQLSEFAVETASLPLRRGWSMW